MALAKASPDASIHLVHVHEEPLIYGEIAVYVPRARMEELQRANSEGMLAAAEAAARHAERLGCDAIVVGRHGKSTIGDLLMGSVAMKVLHLTPLPVLLVR